VDMINTTIAPPSETVLKGKSALHEQFIQSSV
jgi:hypothetical protein